MTETSNWGDKISITGDVDRYKIDVLNSQINAARERMYAEILNPELRIKPNWTVKDRITLALKVLIGQINWDDIN